eukprot:TRINITY_DN12712_c0_g1_i7.p1 TRINITY_DN12712_c0_g1~~TRINITY_DN12712_c0_g1_i7.p1  ORF type:complete len:148 (-),score=21.96 TRINITY_DN12712_c0_g1_i7:208-651(-)
MEVPLTESKYWTNPRIASMIVGGILVTHLVMMGYVAAAPLISNSVYPLLLTPRNGLIVTAMLILAMLPLLEPSMATLQSITRRRLVRFICWVLFCTFALLLFILNIVREKKATSGIVFHGLAIMLVHFGMGTLTYLNTVLEGSLKPN